MKLIVPRVWCKPYSITTAWGVLGVFVIVSAEGGRLMASVTGGIGCGVIAQGLINGVGEIRVSGALAFARVLPGWYTGGGAGCISSLFGLPGGGGGARPAGRWFSIAVLLVMGLSRGVWSVGLAGLRWAVCSLPPCASGVWIAAAPLVGVVRWWCVAIVVVFRWW
eukprot:5194367-Prymnesium_polylepis.1